MVVLIKSDQILQVKSRFLERDWKDIVYYCRVICLVDNYNCVRIDAKCWNKHKIILRVSWCLGAILGFWALDIFLSCCGLRTFVCLVLADVLSVSLSSEQRQLQMHITNCKPCVIRARRRHIQNPGFLVSISAVPACSWISYFVSHPALSFSHHSPLPVTVPRDFLCVRG